MIVALTRLRRRTKRGCNVSSDIDEKWKRSSQVAVDLRNAESDEQYQSHERGDKVCIIILLSTAYIEYLRRPTEKEGTKGKLRSEERQ